MSGYVKPPLGVMPKWLWLEMLECLPPSEIELKERRVEVSGAVSRYRAAGFSVNPEWLLELNER